ncbi:hypothetical protein EI94DRAFT_1708103 [Lactarius quietus]|nr:hypothetical protein EI94DRAFT_1708103 [Lactarius quietus]
MHTAPLSLLFMLTVFLRGLRGPATLPYAKGLRSTSVGHSCKGYIFLEGEQEELKNIANLVTIFNTGPSLIPLEQHVALLLPHVMSPCQIEEGQWIQRKSGDEFLFAEETYCASLIMKNITTHSVITVAHAPINLLPFIRASCVCNNPSFAPWAHRFAQDNIRLQQQVRVESGEQKGIIGQPRIITYGVATIVPENEGDIPLFNVSLRALSLQYVLGNNVKDRWSDSHGMVVKINEDQNILVYIDKDSLYEGNGWGRVI